MTLEAAATALYGRFCVNSVTFRITLAPLSG